MPKGISVHIGVNNVDSAQYGSQFTVLKGCANDARDMQGIAQSQALPQQFETTLLIDSDATSVRVINTIGEAAKRLEKDDMFLITFSGHGGKLRDPINGDEPDSQDETLVLYDRNLIDDELYALWKRFAAGVRILFICDSCHSGTVAQVSPAEPVENPAAAEDEDGGFFGNNRPFLDENGEPRLIRTLSGWAQDNHEGKFQEVYDAVRYPLTAKSKVKASVGASLIQISACQDFELALDGTQNSLFTGMLLQVWANGAFEGDYHKFFEEIRTKTAPFRQNPNFFRVGVTNNDFESQRPFFI